MPTTIRDGSVYDGEYIITSNKTIASGATVSGAWSYEGNSNLTLTIEDGADVSGMDLSYSTGTGSLSVIGATSDAFNSVSGVTFITALGFEGFANGETLSIYDATGTVTASPLATITAATDYTTSVGDLAGIGTTITTLRLVATAVGRTTSIRDLDIPEGGSLVEPVSTIADGGYSSNATLTGNEVITPTISVTAPHTGKLVATTQSVSAGDVQSNLGYLLNLRDTQPYRDVIAVQDLEVDFITSEGTTAVAVDLNHFICSTSAVGQYFTGVTLNNLDVPNNLIFSILVQDTLVNGGETVMLFVDNRGRVEGISGDTFQAGLDGFNEDIQVTLNVTEGNVQDIVENELDFYLGE